MLSSAQLSLVNRSTCFLFFVCFIFCLLQMYDLRHLSIEMWQMTSQNGYATALRLLGPQWVGIRVIVCDYTPGGFKRNVCMMVSCHFLLFDIFCSWSYFHSEWLVKGSCVHVCLCLASPHVYVNSLRHSFTLCKTLSSSCTTTGLISTALNLCLVMHTLTVMIAECSSKADQAWCAKLED